MEVVVLKIQFELNNVAKECFFFSGWIIFTCTVVG